MAISRAVGQAPIVRLRRSAASKILDASSRQRTLASAASGVAGATRMSSSACAMASGRRPSIVSARDA